LDKRTTMLTVIRRIEACAMERKPDAEEDKAGRERNQTPEKLRLREKGSWWKERNLGTKKATTEKKDSRWERKPGAEVHEKRNGSLWMGKNENSVMSHMRRERCRWEKKGARHQKTWGWGGKSAERAKRVSGLVSNIKRNYRINRCCQQKIGGKPSS